VNLGFPGWICLCTYACGVWSAVLDDSVYVQVRAFQSTL
jgi:hypothetical protein